MDDESSNWLNPEQALTRFKRPDISILDLDVPSQSIQKKRYGYVLGNIGFLIPENTLSEVMKDFQVYAVPNTQAWMKGLTNLRGNLIPVYDLSLLLGLSEEITNYENLLVLDTGTRSVAILIESLPKTYEISKWKALSHSPQLPGHLSEYVSEVYAVKESIWLSFDHHEYFKHIKEQVAL